ELIERGYIYIAQPPLYKVKKGKQERYVKDDQELNSYLLTLALSNAQLHVQQDTPAISDTALEELVKSYMSVQSVITRLSRRYDETILQQLPKLHAIEKTDLNDSDKIQTYLDSLLILLNNGKPSGIEYRVGFSTLEEKEYAQLEITKIVHGLDHLTVFNAEFFESTEYKLMNEMFKKLDGLFTEGSYIKRGEKRQPVTDIGDVKNWLFEEARKGLNIQRYKGLGEMNPDQLWETTMNPETRRMLQVRIEDAIVADEVFTTLMGDHVEPRREFIESNALSAMNIDT
ncbi:DNA gyrase subunit B, partial [hydrothermal vent metagenome]